MLSRAIALLGMCSLAPKPCVSTIYQASTPRPSSTNQELRSQSSGLSICEGGFPPLACTFSFLLTIVYQWQYLPHFLSGRRNLCLRRHALLTLSPEYQLSPAPVQYRKQGSMRPPEGVARLISPLRAPVFPIAELLTLSSAKPSNHFPPSGLTGVLIAAPPFRELDIPCIIKQAPPQPRLLFQSRVVQISWIFTPLDTSQFLFLPLQHSISPL